jgi:hypothetical protein
MLRQSKEIIADAMPRRQTPVNEGPVITVEDVFFTGLEGKAPADFCACRKYATQNHVAAEVHVLMAVKARGCPAIEAREFVHLGRKHLAKSHSQKRIVDDERIFVSAKKSANPLVIPAQQRRNIRTSETLCEINMQAGVESGRCCQQGGAFRVFHEDHCTRGSDPFFSMADEYAIGGQAVSAKIIGINNKHAI